MNRFALALLVMFSVSACHCGRTRAPAPVAQAVEAPAPEVPPVDPPRFTATIQPVGEYGLERDGIVVVDLALREGLTLHADYPVRLALRAPSGLGVVKTNLERADAKVTEPGHVVIEARLHPMQTGRGMLDGTWTFAVCEGTVCEPQTAEVSTEIEVR